jgi:hypothetical protein
MDQMDLTDIYGAFHLADAQYTFFSAAHGISSKIDHILGHRAFGRCKKIEISSYILSEQNGIKLNSTRDYKKY